MPSSHNLQPCVELRHLADYEVALVGLVQRLVMLRSAVWGLTGVQHGQGAVALIERLISTACLLPVFIELPELHGL